MSQLRDIQDAATNSAIPIQDLLKKCLVLAARLNHQPLREWATQELNGYGDAEALPDYRRLHIADVKCNVVLGNSWATNVSVAREAVPEDVREDFFAAPMFAGVASLQELAASENEIGVSVDAGLAQAIVQRMYADNLAGCLSMRRIVGRTQVVGVLDTVRTRILEFALEIEKLNPEAGDVEGGVGAVSSDQIQHVYNTTILGGATNVAVGGHDFTQVALSVKQNDWPSLSAALDRLGLEAETIEELKEALDEDEADRPKGSFGERTRAWLGRIAEKVAIGTIQLASVEGIKLIVRAVMTYLTGGPGPGGPGGMTVA